LYENVIISAVVSWYQLVCVHVCAHEYLSVGVCALSRCVCIGLFVCVCVRARARVCV